MINTKIKNYINRNKLRCINTRSKFVCEHYNEN